MGMRFWGQYVLDVLDEVLQNFAKVPFILKLLQAAHCFYFINFATVHGVAKIGHD